MCSTQSLSHYCTTTGKKVRDLVLGVPGRYIMRFIASILNHIKVLLCLVCRKGGEREKGKEGEREGVLCMLREELYLWYCIHPPLPKPTFSFHPHCVFPSDLQGEK